MEIITVQVRDKKGARLLLDLLQSLDFVNAVKLESEKAAAEDVDKWEETPVHEAFGMWKDTDITAQSLREQAWARQSR